MTTDDTQFTVGKTTFFRANTRPIPCFASSQAFPAGTPASKLRN